MKPNYEFRLPIFNGGRVLVFFDAKKYNDWQEKAGLEISDITSSLGLSSWSIVNDKHRFIIFTDPKDIHTIYHECLHTAWNILHYHNITVNIDNHESLAYVQNYLAEKIEKAAEKYNREENNG